MLIWQRMTCKGTHQDIVQDCNPDKPHRVQLPAYCFWEVWKAHNFHQNFEWQPLCPSLIAWYFLKIEIEILNLIIPKPEIPNDIARNYQQVKVEWSKKLVAEKQQEKESVIKQTQEMKAVADAKRAKAVKKSKKIASKEYLIFAFF